MEILDRVSTKGWSKVRLIGNDTNEIVLIEEAFSRAEDGGLDLVLVSKDAQPPVVRIQDFMKLEYERKKAKKLSKKSSGALKEMQFKINISAHDLQTKINSIEKFLERGDKAKISVRLKGRERENPERATQLIDRIGSLIEGKMTKFPGPIAMALIEPGKSK